MADTAPLSNPNPAISLPTSVLRQLRFAALALASATVCAFLALHHPLLGAWALLPCVMAAAISYRAPGAWPLWLLPLLPLVDAMPWTGWLMVEEFDLLVLAVAAGAYARWALDRSGRATAMVSLSQVWGLLLLAFYAASLAVSMQRGVTDAGGLVWGWWQGYHESMNALRLAKSFVLSMLLLPLWLRAHREDSSRASRHLLFGMTGMLAMVALTVLWERLAYTGLLNFSSDYRATGLFWEMHVGGAALDAALALAMPFALAAFLDARRACGFLIAAAVMAIGTYASLVTFSRVVYAAVPISFVLQVALRSVRRRHDEPPLVRAHSFASPALLVVFVVAALALFHGSGYRGMLALLGVFTLVLPLGVSAMALSGRSAVAAVVGAMLLAVLSWWATTWALKAAYVSYAVVALSGIACVVVIENARHQGRLAPVRAVLTLLSCTLALCAGIFIVARTWGGPPAGSTAALVGGTLAALVLVIVVARRAPWPASLRWQGMHLAALAMLVLVVGVFDGGSYMDARWSTLQNDTTARFEHARTSLDLLNGPLDQAFGRGLGRYAASQVLTGNPQDQTGDYLWLDDNQGPRLLLTSGKHMLGWGEMLRISQRIAPVGRHARVRVRVRAPADIVLHGEVCEKNLLYNNACLAGATKVHANGGAWQNIEWSLNGEPPTVGHWYAPRFIVFSFALESPGSRAEFSHVQLVAEDGHAALANADFHEGLSRWFFSSDRYHLPWHAKNLMVHLLFEQGIVGCALFALLGVTAFWRLSIGSLARHPLAPALAAALLGVAVVGTADSLLDMPRIAFLIYLMLGAALFMRNTFTRSSTDPSSW